MGVITHSRSYKNKWIIRKFQNKIPSYLRKNNWPSCTDIYIHCPYFFFSQMIWKYHFGLASVSRPWPESHRLRGLWPCLLFGAGSKPVLFLLRQERRGIRIFPSRSLFLLAWSMRCSQIAIIWVPFSWLAHTHKLLIIYLVFVFNQHCFNFKNTYISKGNLISQP